MDEENYHDYQAVRGHLIDETFDTEQKIKNYLHVDKHIIVLALNYYLGLEGLRDFVTQYKNKERCDDPLSKMAKFEIQKKKIKLIGNIDEFWGFPFNNWKLEQNIPPVIVMPHGDKHGDKKIDI